MFVFGVRTIAEGLSAQQRLQAVAALLGVLLFGVIVLVAERRNHSHEVVPPGRSDALAVSEAPRDVRRPPAAAVPIASARVAADEVKPIDPYPVPFLGAAGPDAELPRADG